LTAEEREAAKRKRISKRNGYWLKHKQNVEAVKQRVATLEADNEKYRQYVVDNAEVLSTSRKRGISERGVCRGLKSKCNYSKAEIMAWESDGSVIEVSFISDKNSENYGCVDNASNYPELLGLRCFRSPFGELFISRGIDFYRGLRDADSGKLMMSWGAQETGQSAVNNSQKCLYVTSDSFLKHKSQLTLADVVEMSSKGKRSEIDKKKIKILRTPGFVFTELIRLLFKVCCL
jgi:hypothetical protein